MSTPPRLFLIDGFSNVFRAFYAIRELSTAKGEPTNAVYGFVQMLRKLLRDENPELVGVAWDVSDVTVRSERYAEYKANRAPMPEALRPQLPWIRRALAAFRIPVLELEGYEADDVLGTLARQAAGRGYEVGLVSADKALMQLVGPGVSVFQTGRGRLYDEAAVRASNRSGRSTPSPAKRASRSSPSGGSAPRSHPASRGESGCRPSRSAASSASPCPCTEGRSR